MSSILETFYILFKSNSDDVKKGASDAEQAGKGLESQLTRTDETAALMAENLKGKFLEVGAAIAAAFGAEKIAEMVLGTAELNAQLGLTAERLGIDIEDLDAWGQATQRAGGSVEGFQQSLDFLNRGIADIATKGTSRLKPFFDELKVRVTDGPHQVRPLLDILKDLGDKFKGLDAQQRAGIAEKLGLDPGTVLLIAQGRRGIEDLVNRAKALGVVTAEDAEKAHKFQIALEDLKQQAGHLATEFGSSILPALTEFFKWVGKAVDYLSAHKGLVIGFFAGVAAVVLWEFTTAIVGAAAAVWGFLTPILAVLAPILLVGAALALVTDDIWNFLEGNKSVIGELSKKWPALGETVRDAAKNMRDGWKDFVASLTTSKNLIEQIFKDITEADKQSAKSLIDSQQKIIKANDANWPKMAAWAKEVNKAVDELGAALERIGKSVVFGFLANIAKGIGAIPGAVEHALASAHESLAENNETDPTKRAAMAAKFEADRKARIEAFAKAHTAKAAPVTIVPAGPAKAAPTNPRVPSIAGAGKLPAGAPVAGGHPVIKAPIASGAPLRQALEAAKATIHVANTSHLNTVNHTAGSVDNRRAGDRTVTVRIDKVEVNAPEAKTTGDIAGALADHLTTHMRQAVDHFDDGVKA